MNKRIVGDVVGVPNPKTDWSQTDETKADFLKNKPTKLSQFENDGKFVSEGHKHSYFDVYEEEFDLNLYDYLSGMRGRVDSLEFDIYDLYKFAQLLVSNMPRIDTVNLSDADYYLLDCRDTNNVEVRLIGKGAKTIAFAFYDGEYPNDYITGISFDSGEYPASLEYEGSGIINWVGTDCTTVDGYSIFQPSANTHYDVVIYFNGTQFVGLVNGFVPAIGNQR